MKCYEENTTMQNGDVRVRRFEDIDNGSHFKWTYFSLGGKEYPIGSGDILCRHEIDWGNTIEI